FQEFQFVADWIGKHRFKNKAFPLTDQFLAEFSNDLRRFIGINFQLASDRVRIEEAQPCRFQVGMVKGCLACAVGSGQSDQDRTLIQEGTRRGLEASVFFSARTLASGVHRLTARTGWNLRLTNRPVVRLPLASILTSSPPGAD